ncbi:glutathione S-transferase N-terminal domain-containing protein, partial [Escherichia coli]|uniref:glutathione S-transferase N-terminal domain-containing protein n=1 Tax=Escherichia coli TaxID=562 RepID=UPI0021174D9E
FYAPGACSLASHIALEEAGADYEAIKLDFSQGEQRRPEYLKINPKGRVPVLVTDKGVLTESPVILGYIAQTHPDANLANNDDSYAF